MWGIDGGNQEVKDICCVGVLIQFVFVFFCWFFISVIILLCCVRRLHGLVREGLDQKNRTKKGNFVSLLLGIDYIFSI
jgi:uncharacterized membrane protein YhaH (DUF805 family)